MKMHRIRFIVLLAALLSLASCRSLVLENRIDCPRFMFFDVLNGELFSEDAPVYAAVFSHPAGFLMDKQLVRLGSIIDGSFYFTLKGEYNVHGYGVLGYRYNQLQNETEFIIPYGSESDPLFRFYYTVPTQEESFTVPVEFVKDYAHVDLEFVGIETLSSKDGSFPLDLIVRGNTCGIDAYTGKPIAGDFNLELIADSLGHYSFNLPRLGDDELKLDIYGREGAYEVSGLLDTLDLWHIIMEQSNITWVEKNLPDIRIVIDYKEMSVKVIIVEWIEEDLGYDY